VTAVAPSVAEQAQVAPGWGDRPGEDPSAGEPSGSTGEAVAGDAARAVADTAGADASGPFTTGPDEAVMPPLPEPQPAGLFPEEAFGSGYLVPASFPTPLAADDAIPAAPSVVIDDGILFTHTNPEPPEPAGAPVELSGEGPQHLPPSVALPSHDPD
jgi:hypothetical protein